MANLLISSRWLLATQPSAERRKTCIAVRNATHIQIIQDPRINLSRELVEELLQQFDIDKHRTRVRQLVGYDSQECLWAEGA
jgi:hypothetical protein